MSLNYDTAKAIIEEAHRAWSVGDVDAVLRTYTEDIWFQRNSSDAVSPPKIVHGRDAMGVFLREILKKAEGIAVLESFQFHNGSSRARILYFLKDRKTGQSITATYRQIATFRGMQVSRLEQFHDAALLAAFFRLIEAPVSFYSDTRTFSDVGETSDRKE